MPTPKKGARLGGSPAHQKLILSNLAAQLIEHRGLTTTEAKAKLLRPYVEKLITKAKRGDQHARRTVLKKIPNKGIVAILFEELVPAMDPERAGGYTRLIRVGNRKGDNAPLMRIEHHAVLNCDRMLRALGFDVSFVYNDADGRISTEALESVMHDDDDVRTGLSLYARAHELEGVHLADASVGKLLALLVFRAQRIQQLALPVPGVQGGCAERGLFEAP